MAFNDLLMAAVDRVNKTDPSDPENVAAFFGAANPDEVVASCNRITGTVLDTIRQQRHHGIIKQSDMGVVFLMGLLTGVEMERGPHE